MSFDKDLTEEQMLAGQRSTELKVDASYWKAMHLLFNISDLYAGRSKFFFKTPVQMLNPLEKTCAEKMKGENAFLMEGIIFERLCAGDFDMPDASTDPQYRRPWYVALHEQKATPDDYNFERVVPFVKTNKPGIYTLIDRVASTPVVVAMHLKGLDKALELWKFDPDDLIYDAEFGHDVNVP